MDSSLMMPKSPNTAKRSLPAATFGTTWLTVLHSPPLQQR